MLEPQSTALFLLLIVAFCGLLGWLVLARQLVFRVLAACLAFIPAMLFGMAAVNKHYDYYQTWGSIAADLSGQSTSQGAAPSIDHASGQQTGAILGSKVNLKAAAAVHGQTVRLTVPGKLSHLRRACWSGCPAVLPGCLPRLPVPGRRAAAWLPGPPGGLDQRGRHHGRVPHAAP